MSKFDILITNGKIIDGTGNSWFSGDIGVTGKKILKIGNIKTTEATKIIDAKGLVVCPGFIDIHSHSDYTTLFNPKQESSIRQGITTNVVGNCGDTLAPISPLNKKEQQKKLETMGGNSGKLLIIWSTFKQYLKKVEEMDFACNMVHLVGHSTVRSAVIGFENRNPTEKELEIMKNHVAEAMEAGALGLSTGLIYPPGIYAKTDELIELSKVISKYGGYYFTHMRNYNMRFMIALREAIKIGKKANVYVQISHISIDGKPLWGASKRLLKLLEKERGKGVNINLDMHPYDSAGTHLIMLMPSWVYQGGNKELVERLKDPDIRKKINKNHLINLIENLGWENILVYELNSDKYKSFEGKSVKKIAELNNADEFSTYYNILIEENANPSMIIRNLRSEYDIINFMKNPFIAFETDGAASAPYGYFGKMKIHPRTYGTYPKILGEYIREKKILPLETAIRKMTSLPAQMIGMRYRGTLKSKNFADITIFNPETIIDTATYLNPHQYPIGIEYVIVNGVIVINKGEHSGKLPGKVIRHDSNSFS